MHLSCMRFKSSGRQLNRARVSDPFFGTGHAMDRGKADPAGRESCAGSQLHRPRPAVGTKETTFRCPNGRDITSFTSSQPETKLSGLMEWTTPMLVEIEYTEELKRLYRCEMMQEAA